MEKGLNLMVTTVGRYFVGWLVYLFEILTLFYATMRTAVVSKAQGFRPVIGVIAAQVYFTGWQAVNIVSGLGLVIGFLFVAQMTNPMLGFGNIEGTIKLLLSAVMRELAPLLTTLIVIARSGTAVASELGNMKVNREVDALVTMGIHPLNFIVYPRLVGGAVSVFVLGCYFAFASGLGGLLSAWLVGQIPPAYFMSHFLMTVTWADFFILGLKLAVSGALVFSIASYHGLSAQKSPTEVPVVTTQAVMKSIIFVLGTNVVISIAYYLYSFSRAGVL